MPLYSREGKKDRDDTSKETPKDFLIEAPPEDNRKEVDRKIDTKLEDTKLNCAWKLYTGEASSFDGSGAGLMLIDPEGKEYTYALYSQLLVNQVKGIYAAKLPAIREYLQRTKETLRRFRSYTIEHIRRNQNKKADALSKPASMTFQHLTKEVLVEVLARRSIDEKEESRKIIIKAPQYNLIKGSLYKKSFYTPWLRCIALPKTNDVIKEIHEGSCGFNKEPCSMVVRITKQGYYWSSMHRDVSRVIQDCEKCKEKFAMKKRAEIRAIASGNAWPFSHWGVKILGPLSMALGGLKFLALAIEHSTKWIEAKPLTTDEKHFKEGIFADLYRGFKVTQSFSPITVHMEIMSRIKKQLARSQQEWVDNLSQILWVHRTLPRNNQEETPFSLTYGSNVIIPTVKSIIAKAGRGRIKEMTKRKESKEVASIEKAYYQNELRSLEDVMKRVATLHLNIDKEVKDLRPHMSLRLIKRIKELDSKSSKSSNMMGDYVPRGSLPSRLA
ncbi:reverse transcriptase domain-containing protein [Tanacetum coccineum]